MRTSNPIFSAKSFRAQGGLATANSMSVQGTINKAGIMLVLLLLSASWVWGRTLAMGQVSGLTTLGAFGGFIVAMVTIFKKEWSGVTAPVYAILEGLFIGGLSAMLEVRYPGVVFQAAMLTFGTAAALFMAYSSGLIQVTQRLRLMIVSATGGIFLVYLTSMVLGFFGVSIPMIHSSGTIGIVFSLIVVGIAAMNLVLDFDFIEQGAQYQFPKYMGWYGAFGLMVTLIWLYIEMLRLLSKIRSNR